MSRSESVSVITESLNTSALNISGCSASQSLDDNKPPLKANASRTTLLRNESNDSFISSEILSSPNPYSSSIDTQITNSNETIISQTQHKIEPTINSESSNDFNTLLKQNSEIEEVVEQAPLNVNMNDNGCSINDLDNVNSVNNITSPASPLSPSAIQKATPIELVTKVNGTNGSKIAIKRPHSPVMSTDACVKKANVNIFLNLI